jgi:hypothetical protein
VQICSRHQLLLLLLLPMCLGQSQGQQMQGCWSHLASCSSAVQTASLLQPTQGAPQTLLLLLLLVVCQPVLIYRPLLLLVATMMQQ